MAETTTISNLPQITIDELTNDTLVPVENVDGTKAANLAQLRKKLNSLYVEMVDADLNELKQDGIYECWGTTLNAPTSEVAAWIIQTAEHEGVVVQNAFGLGTTSYSYVYRRRWNGVSWTAWENKIQTLETVKANVDLSNLSAVGQAKFDAKANVSNTVTTDTAQTITGLKTFNNSSDGNRTDIMIVTDVGMGDDANNKWAGSIQFKKGNVDVAFCEALKNSSNAAIAQLMAFNSVNGQNIFSWVRTVVESNGYAFASAPTPSAGAISEEIVTAGWFRQSGCTARTVIETYNNGSNWYRIWSDGWVEQGGVITARSNGTTINFLKPFRDANYVVLSSQMYRGYNNDAYNGNNEIGGIEPSRCVFYSGVSGNNTQRWMAQGYVA